MQKTRCSKLYQGFLIFFFLMSGWAFDEIWAIWLGPPWLIMLLDSCSFLINRKLAKPWYNFQADRLRITKLKTEWKCTYLAPVTPGADQRFYGRELVGNGPEMLLDCFPTTFPTSLPTSVVGQVYCICSKPSKLALDCPCREVVGKQSGGTWSGSLPDCFPTFQTASRPPPDLTWEGQGQ